MYIDTQKCQDNFRLQQSLIQHIPYQRTLTIEFFAIPNPLYFYSPVLFNYLLTISLHFFTKMPIINLLHFQ